MKKFTKGQIEGTRNYFRKSGFQEVEVALGSRRFSYFVVPQACEPNLPDFVMRMTGEPEDVYLLGISDSTKPEYRQYAVAHEFIEFTEIGIDTPDRCTRALDEELKLVPDDIKKAYISMRADFFKNLIQYCSKQPEFYTPEDLNQFRKNVSKLENLLNQ